MNISALLASAFDGRLDILRPDRLIYADSLALPLLSIDGGSATGKSSLCKRLCQKLSFDAVHMDDFFLPFDMRNAQRLSEPGGNLDRERFCVEVMPFLKAHEGFSYGVFDCSNGEINSHRSVAANRAVVVEGVYSNHPAFGDIYDLKIFLRCPFEERKHRIVEREDGFESFEKRWIPMEDAYFTKFSIMENCDIIIDTGIAL